MRANLHEAFIQEGAFLSELCTETASIVQPRDVGTYTAENGTWIPFMVLEWLDGQNLDQLLEQEQRCEAFELVFGERPLARGDSHGEGVGFRRREVDVGC